MIRNYFLVALRNILKQKTYNVLNVTGLAIGIAAGLLIALHIREELSYEKGFAGYENIYRIHREGWAKATPPLAREFKDFMPEVESIASLASYGDRIATTDLGNPIEVSGFFADSTFFDVFGIRILDGDTHPLRTANTVVVTSSTARRLFGDNNPIGKVLKFDTRQEFPITAVIDDLPKNSHLDFDFLISMSTFYENTPPEWTSSRGWMVMYTYARIKPGAISHITEKMPSFIRTYYKGDPEIDKKVESKAWRLMPLGDIHLYSNLENEMRPNSSIVYVYIFVAVEFFILLIASANFMSLFTTQTIRRVKEVGMRKIMGAHASQLVAQFLLEALLLTGAAVFLAVIFYQLILPYYNNLAGQTLGIWQIFETNNLVVIFSILAGVVLISGLYPAFFISKFNAGSFLKSSKLPDSMPNLVRNGLVIFQFVISISLIAATLIVGQQMNHMKNSDLGFDKDQVVNIKMYGSLWYKAYTEADVFRNEFMKNPDILAMGRTDNMIGSRLSIEAVVPQGKDQDRDGIPNVRVLRVDEGYIDAMGIQLAAGRNFSPDFNDSTSFIVNESAVKALGITDPLNEILHSQTNGRTGRIVGVVKDYHFASMRDQIEPLIIEYKPEWTDYLTIKIRAGKTKETLDYIEKTSKSIAKNNLFIYDFLDDRLNELYRSEDNMAKVFQFFSALAILIACLGLLGLSAHTIENRTKEIGIRKVLGSSVAGIIKLISTRFFLLVVIGFAIATPLTWYGMHQWLSNFAYKVDIEWWIFIATGTGVLSIAAVVIAFHTLKAANGNPVDSLRSE